MKKTDRSIAIFLVVIYVMVSALILEHYMSLAKESRIQHATEIAALRARYQKVTLIKPNKEWIEAHGDSLESHQTYNLNLLVANVRNKQKIPAKAVEK